MSTDEIWVIGTEPPCPRCDYLKQRVVDIVNDLQLPVAVRHVEYESDEAHQLAREAGLVPGTAKDVAQRLGITMNWTGIYNLIDSANMPESGSDEPQCCPSIAAKWTPKLDDALRPCETRALEAGIMMTPVLVINGKPVHQGSVPDADQTRAWIEAAFAQHSQASGPPADTVIEVLGPGCKKCDTLYDNVQIAVANSGNAEGFLVKKRTDISYFLKMGVTVTPGLIINGSIVSTGRVPTPDQIVALLEDHRGK